MSGLTIKATEGGGDVSVGGGVISVGVVEPQPERAVATTVKTTIVHRSTKKLFLNIISLLLCFL
jgi:hypothetical protein